MSVLIYVITAVAAYLVAGLNPAIILSNAIYHEDIRKKGSGNAGFTNFKRVYGNKYAWFVFVLDILKGVVICAVAYFVYEIAFGTPHLGVAYAAFFAIIGHSFPVWYGFQGGKGFLVGATAIWFIDWRVALIAAAIWIVLLFTVKYMSLSVVCAAATCPITLLIFGPENVATWIFCTLGVLLLIFRHLPNLIRLSKGKEPKFHVK